MVKRSIVAALPLSLLLLTGGAAAEQTAIPLLAPFGNFALRAPPDPPPPGPPRYYAESGPNPGWQIAQWNIPGGALSPFVQSRSGGNDIQTATSPEATVRIISNRRTRTIELTQDGAVLPCTTPQGNPRESDLLFGPKDRGPPGQSALTTPPVALNSLRSLEVASRVTFRSGTTKSPKGCIVNQGMVGVGIVLENKSRHPPQTLFYQLALNLPCGPGPVARVKECVAGMGSPGYFFRHNPFGVQDYLKLAGSPFLISSESRALNVKLLGRIDALIRSGPDPMDGDPAHWTIQKFYAGQAIWGDSTLSSSWDYFNVIAVFK